MFFNVLFVCEELLFILEPQTSFY